LIVFYYEKQLERVYVQYIVVRFKNVVRGSLTVSNVGA